MLEPRLCRAMTARGARRSVGSDLTRVEFLSLLSEGGNVSLLLFPRQAGSQLQPWHSFLSQLVQNADRETE